MKPLSKILTPLIALILGLSLTLLPLDYIEYLFYDLRMASKPHQALSNKLEIISTNNETLEKLKQIPDFEQHTELLKILEQAHPAAVVYVTKINALKGSPLQQKSFVNESRKLKYFYQITDELATKFETDKLKLRGELAPIPVFSGPRTSDKNIFAKDKVTRRMMINYQNRKMLHTILAEIFNPKINDTKNIRGIFPLFDSEQVYINYQPKQSFETTALEDVLNHKANPQKFTNKIVLIGDDLQLSFDDYVRTPYSHEGLAMSAQEVHANMLETLITNSAPIETPHWLDILLTLIVSFLSVYIVLIVKPIRGIILLTGSTLIFTAICFSVFWVWGYWIPMAHPFTAFFVSYYFFIPYRLIIENRKSWEYFQKNKLLSEVEELKTNFIGMMSHDLKTPLARIQGMTEIIVQDKVTLSSQQREAIDTIRQSSEDLLKFISTILNYAKIESDGVLLHLQSRDINQLLKEVIKKHEFLAKLKHIQIVAELETLFSIPVDAELVKQVFSNLLENAIKYSPDNSKVLISSEELGGKIVVQFADQGMGIPEEELSNIFMKFFRSRDAKTSPIKGSGLGLYLAKYFIELHKGNITCESTPGVGSTFIVELPVQN